MHIGVAQLKNDGVLIELNFFDDSVLEVGEEKTFFIAWLLNGSFIDAYEPENSVDVRNGDGGSQFEDSLVDTFFLLDK